MLHSTLLSLCEAAQQFTLSSTMVIFLSEICPFEEHWAGMDSAREKKKTKLLERPHQRYERMQAVLGAAESKKKLFGRPHQF
jgi:hypothetical protein